jgi:hypothetical protein
MWLCHVVIHKAMHTAFILAWFICQMMVNGLQVWRFVSILRFEVAAAVVDVDLVFSTLG